MIVNRASFRQSPNGDRRSARRANQKVSDQSPYTGEATDEPLAKYLAGEIGLHALARAGLRRSGRCCIDSVALPQRPRWIEARQPDLGYDSLRAWLPTRQSFV